jgi:nucleotide-binding universal stress UspA family protein
MKILVGYDGSKAADEAIKLAQKHANVFNADIYIVTSLEQSSTRIRQLSVSRGRSCSICERKQH